MVLQPDEIKDYSRDTSSLGNKSEYAKETVFPTKGLD